LFAAARFLAPPEACDETPQGGQSPQTERRACAGRTAGTDPRATAAAASMEAAMAERYIREAVGLFHDEGSLETAADALMTAGFDRADLSLLAACDTVERRLGHLYRKVSELEDDPAVAHLAFMDTDSRTEAKGVLVGGLAYVGAVAAAGVVVASGGAIAALLMGVAAAGGAGGLIGAALARLVGRHHAQYLQQHLDRGGLLLWVRTADADEERLACDLLARHGAEDVHVHALPEPPGAPGLAGLSYDLSFMRRLGM
jgi:hypothetical protein